MNEDTGLSGGRLSRRAVLKGIGGAALAGAVVPLWPAGRAGAAAATPLFHVKNMPRDPFLPGTNRHAGFQALLALLGGAGLRFHRSPTEGPTSGPGGMIAADDVVLVKVNAQWKYRGATNSDLVRGIVQAVLDHPDGFTGEVVMVENGQGRGSLRCDTALAYADGRVRANAEDPRHSFTWLARRAFPGRRVSTRLLDPIRERFIARDDHRTEGYRRRGKVSYPCFSTRAGTRVELGRGLWREGAYSQKLKLINVPVLKTHSGCGYTAALKHCYGLLSMKDGHVLARHYDGLGRACAEMFALVRAPVLNVVDATWVSHRELRGYPRSATRRVDQIMASQDPVALDRCAGREILLPIDGNPAHDPDAPAVRRWLRRARDRINELGGLHAAEGGLDLPEVTLDDARLARHEVTL